MSPCSARLFRFHNLGPPNAIQGIDRLRMIPFKLNDPLITGYSACWQGRILRLQAHVEGEDLTFYKNIDACQRSVIWVYMPVNPDELVSELWYRAGKMVQGAAILVREQLPSANISNIRTAQDE